ncbi:hypothetical protein HNP33_002535 [Comamonas odontotermitis]|uniref:Uncharacterized protein n=1 Tax=Comamonas odontotermitis TaxID=379895 RepID=A0ABR6RH13_9BURK|nr:hypothetical protein [Comamonas odontotermitis]MBB6578453.1 hypothetical protein [Comamonas odontotermitis]
MVESAQPKNTGSSGHLQYYTPVLLRGVSPMRKTGWWCVSFEAENGEVVRLRLSAADASALVEAGYRDLADAGCTLQLDASPLKFVIDELQQDSSIKEAVNA